MKLRGVNLLIAFVFVTVSLSCATPVTPATGRDSFKKPKLQSATVAKSSHAITGAPSGGVFVEYAAAASEPADNSCGFSSPCYSTIRAPEPQSLFLVGSGLVAMAGLIRRRVAR
jgi:hypothetical protein